MTVDLLIDNASVVRSSGVKRLKIGITSGKISVLAGQGEDVPARERIDATGMIVLPGAIDVHVHAGYGEPERETMTAVTMAAAAGGITTVFDQPLSSPSTVTAQTLRTKAADLAGQSVVDFALWGGLVPGHVEELDAMMALGAQAFKSFMCRCSNYPMTPDGVLLRGMRRVGELGGLVAVHAENDTLIHDLVECAVAEGRRDVGAFIDAHPVYSELEAVNRFINLASLVPHCKCHIVHLSIPEGAVDVKRSKDRGIANITVETSPQYLGLDQDDLYRIGGVAKCDPPVRSKESVERLWELVKDGTVDMIASDHSPHTSAKKKPENGDFWSIPEGVTGVQTLLPVVVTEGMKRGLTWPRLAELVSTNPAKRFGLYGRKGDIEIGFDADLVLFDPSLSWTLKTEDLYYVNKHSPFVGRTFAGRVKTTLVRGEVVYQDGRILVEPGFGRFHRMEVQQG